MRFVLALSLMCFPLVAGAQEKYWEKVEPPVYEGGATYRYVSPGLLEDEVVEVRTRYSNQVSELARLAYATRKSGRYALLTKAHTQAAGPNDWALDICKEFTDLVDRGHCLAENIVRNDVVEISMAYRLDNAAWFVRPVLFESGTDIMEFAVDGYNTENNGHLMSLDPFVRFNDSCFPSADDIKPKRLFSGAKPAISTAFAEGCAKGPFRSAFISLTLDREQFVRYVVGSREQYRKTKRLNYKAVGVRYRRENGRPQTIYTSFLDLLTFF
ncbi:MAG: hypothetical protein AAF641_14070 [Pseudomonadota bacterium]